MMGVKRYCNKIKLYLRDSAFTEDLKSDILYFVLL